MPIPVQRAGQLDQTQVVGGLLVVTHQDPPALRQPGERPLHHPTTRLVTLRPVARLLLRADPPEVRGITRFRRCLATGGVVGPLVQAPVLLHLRRIGSLDHDRLDRRLQAYFPQVARTISAKFLAIGSRPTRDPPRSSRHLSPPSPAGLLIWPHPRTAGHARQARSPQFLRLRPPHCQRAVISPGILASPRRSARANAAPAAIFHYLMKPRPLAVRPEELRAIRRASGLG